MSDASVPAPQGPPGIAPQPVRTTAQTAQPTVVVQSGSGGWMWRLFAFLGWAAFCFVTLLALAQFLAFRDYFDTTQGITEKFHSGEMFGTEKIAIVSIEGLIADGDGFPKAQIDQIRQDKNVKALVVRVDSPGGTVTASDYIYHHLKRLREERQLPLVVSMGGIAASGGYYISMAVGDQEQTIFAEPTSTTGSIGVMFPHYDLSGLLARFDIRDDSIVTHPLKELGSMTKPMPEEHRKLLQSYIDESFDRFKAIVKEGRPKFRADPQALDALATGEIFSANRALSHGLIDKIGFLEEAIERATELAGLSKDEVRVVEYEQPASLFNLAGVAQSPVGRSSPLDWPRVLDLATPRAYYLATSWPPLLSTYSRLW
ncbi:MAG: signal peptide peptidase SppA [Pirellulaceae bacterium]